MTAIEIVRERAGEWHVDPSRVCLCGFSAGGHLAALAGNAFADRIKRCSSAIPPSTCRDAGSSSPGSARSPANPTRPCVSSSRGRSRR
ncbi:MAG: alpha/beta hydrolase fold domain-containing protein [Methanospirillum sp.]|nr:alpha/beta hydrolase fold domain-containing protein [Methanospirillum sp.]